MVKQPLLRFAAQVSIALYVVLLFAEYLRPGFVSTVMNVHVMWVIIVPLTLLAPLNPHSPHLARGSSSAINGGKISSRLALVIIGVILGLIVWHVGEAFGGMRFWFAVAVGFVPLAVSRYSR